MNNIDNMPPKCRDCAYWDVCEYPYVCSDYRKENIHRIKTNKEELIKELISDISWLKQGCQTELEIVEHIEKAVEYLQEKETE